MAVTSDSCGSTAFEWIARRRVLIRNGSNHLFALERQLCTLSFLQASRSTQNSFHIHIEMVTLYFEQPTRRDIMLHFFKNIVLREPWIGLVRRRIEKRSTL